MLGKDRLYWALIEDMNWGELCHEHRAYDAIKRRFMENHSEALADELNQFVAMRFKELDAQHKLYAEIGNSYGNYGGDDSYGDMLHHVIGLGEKTFNNVIEDLSLLDDIDYVESFSYCIPHVSETMNDYKDMDIDTHINNAKTAVKELASIATQQDISKDDMETLRELMNRFMFLVEGDVPSATVGMDEEAYIKFYHFGRDNSDYSAMFANYLKDAKTFLG